MYVSQIPVARSYNNVAPMFDRIAEDVKAQPTLWYQLALDKAPGKHRRGKQIRIHNAMTERGIKVSTACDETSMYIRLRAEEVL